MTMSDCPSTLFQVQVGMKVCISGKGGIEGQKIKVPIKKVVIRGVLQLRNSEFTVTKRE